MLRVNYVGHDDEGIIFGLVVFNGKLQYAEGSRLAAENMLGASFTIPPWQVISAETVAPEVWLEWRSRLDSQNGYFGDVYEDDDDQYDPSTGVFIGENAIPDRELGLELLN